MKPPLTQLQSLRPGAQFYFADGSLADGVDCLTCYRKTPKGYTNAVTGKRYQSFSDFPVIEAHLYYKWKEGHKAQALQEFRSLCPSSIIERAGQIIAVGEWEAYGVRSGRAAVSFVILRNGGEWVFSYRASTFNKSAKP